MNDRATPRWSLILSIAAGSVSAAASVVGLLAPSLVYGRETEALQLAAAAQDWVGLVVACPLVLVLAVRRPVRGSTPHLVWLGGLAFLAYNAAIYCTAVRFGPLFVPWVAVLGTAVWAFVGGWVEHGRALVRRRALGWATVVVAAVFGGLWLTEIVGDLAAGRGSTSAGTWDVPTNPVHVLDLALFLPAAAASGVLLLRGRPVGHVAAPVAVVWMALTCVPIVVTPVVATVWGVTAPWAVVPPVGGLLLVLCLLGVRAVRPGRHDGGTTEAGDTADRDELVS
ncbi:MAG: hypothetical protein Q7T56_09135 [Nocardioidaceae bacterium]|nr:hypothetical protein [Nocardioidaceae bacterium]